MNEGITRRDFLEASSITFLSLLAHQSFAAARPASQESVETTTNQSSQKSNSVWDGVVKLVEKNHDYVLKLSGEQIHINDFVYTRNPQDSYFRFSEKDMTTLVDFSPSSFDDARGCIQRGKLTRLMLNGPVFQTSLSQDYLRLVLHGNPRWSFCWSGKPGEAGDLMNVGFIANEGGKGCSAFYERKNDWNRTGFGDPQLLDSLTVENIKSMNVVGRRSILNHIPYEPAAAFDVLLSDLKGFYESLRKEID